MRQDTELTALVEPVVKGLRLRLWGVELLAQGRRKLLRVYIDREDGVTLSDCEDVSRQLSALFDVEDPIAGEYVLEVSSPGMDRPLFAIEQYREHVGHLVQVKLRRPFEGRRKYKGMLSAVENDEVSIVVDEHEYVLPIESIEKANIVPQFT